MVASRSHRRLGRQKKSRPGDPGRLREFEWGASLRVRRGAMGHRALPTYFLPFFATAAAFLSVIAAWAAASRATGTRNGEQLT